MSPTMPRRTKRADNLETNVRETLQLVYDATRLAARLRAIIEPGLFKHVRFSTALFHVVASHRNRQGQRIPIHYNEIVRALRRGRVITGAKNPSTAILRSLTYNTKRERFRKTAPMHWTIK